MIGCETTEMPDILTPIARIIDVLWSDAELPAKFFRQHLDSFYLAIGRACDFAVRYDANADGLCAAEPVPVRDGRQLPLPPLRRQYVAVGASFAVAYTEMAIDIFRFREAVVHGQLLDIAGVGAAIINLDAVPSIGRLGSLRTNGICDGIETTIGPEGKRAGGRRIMPRGHQEYGAARH